MARIPAKSSELLGSNVRRRREELGWSQAQLAERTGKSNNFISEVELAKTGVSMDFVDTLADALGLAIHELFLPEVGVGGDDAMIRHFLQLESLVADIRRGYLSGRGSSHG